MPTTDFENDDLDGLSSEELEAQAFGPDPSRAGGRRWDLRRSRRSAPPARRDRAATPPAAVAVKRFCYACGEAADADARDCPACGARQPRVPRRRGRRRTDGRTPASRRRRS
ncbi:hypothetical protein RQM47_01610 [Rubrivirga sp. S365]|uniref:Zinc-ribbon domain-containing protein n=1 Tax=Rubrivirga litoralis TaxID=3075598 RepID=A0ABU3BUZ7_9BACT|nr:MULTISPECIES: hypothetical protein [unclassified Rubrivirga]MDT0633117.1 hypothetical protein [Rubrivirga sp. F394]MDT7855330.1 hypothetical protein [Rubrivirga sp. S365]